MNELEKEVKTIMVQTTKEVPLAEVLAILAGAKECYKRSIYYNGLYPSDGLD